VPVDPIPASAFGGAGPPLSNVWFVDFNTIVPLPSQNGAIGSPFSNLQQAIDAAELAQLTQVVLRCTPGNYAAGQPPTLFVTTDLNLSIVCEGLAYLASPSPSNVTPPVTPLTPLQTPDINYGAAGCLLLLEGVLIGNVNGFGVGSSCKLSSSTCSIADVGAGNDLHISGSYIGSAVICSQFFCDSSFIGGAATISAAAAVYFTNSVTQGPISSPVVFWDPSSLAGSRDAGATLTPGALSRCQALETAVVTVTIPAMATGEDQELAVSFAGTNLASALLVGDALAVGLTPAMPLTCVVGSVEVTGPSAATLRIVAIGAHDGGDVDFTFVRLLNNTIP
jgi:hypothetical protein